MNEPNLILDESQKKEQIRQRAIDRLSAGEDFILILPVEHAESCEVHTMSTVGLDVLRVCVGKVSRDMEFLRPGINN
ncbi:hypothetical protein [Salmonirosea aquatica]|uniref:Uncharacterized protein n=1 Tax=Salmonirosea aquatica TaxID=2654236 RepID=A0A7C9BFP4_9BACT|nr:hypothetical protein [Cytophagaceae bacterium SJW1-29]